MNICENCGWYLSATNWCFLSGESASTAVMYCLDKKAADEEDCRPVVHAMWTAEGNDEYGNYWDRCSACQKSVFFPPSVKNDYEYCPHCGAVMDA